MKTIDKGINVVTDASTGQPYEAYVTEMEGECPKCHVTLRGESRVDKDVALLGGDPVGFRCMEDTAFLAALQDELLNHKCEAKP